MTACFTLSHKTNGEVGKFNHSNIELGIKGLKAFVIWLDNLNVKLGVSAIHKLIRDGAVGEYSLNVKEG